MDYGRRIFFFRVSGTSAVDFGRQNSFGYQLFFGDGNQLFGTAGKSSVTSAVGDVK